MTETFRDDKDWTWVLDRPCDECGFEAQLFDPRGVGGGIRSNAGQWMSVLDRDAAWLRRRPRKDKWSPLEYACHVRDVFELYDERLRMMLEEDGPQYPNWDQDRTAIEKDYRSEEPSSVAVGLQLFAESLANRFDSVEGDGWQRRGFRSDGAEFTIDSFARYLIHDPIHHIWDVESG